MASWFRLFKPKELSRVEREPDNVWISTAAKYKGVRNALAAKAAQDSAMVALVAHFPDVLRELETIATEHSGAGSVRAVLARQLSAEGAARFPLGADTTLELIVAERHPLRSVDAELNEFAEALPCRCRIAHHLSLDDPLLRFFGSESIRQLLGRLGATEDEPITHQLITRSIENAQEKIEAKVTNPVDANSAAGWLEVNVRT